MLKSKTHDQHEAAEKHPFHVVLFGGEGLPRAREAYVRSLGQHLHIQETFEPLLRKAAANSYTFRAMVRPYHHHLDALRDDLAALGATSEQTRILPATARFVSTIESYSAYDGTSLLGVWYVFEGSTNGGTIIGKRLKDMLGLPDDRGTRFTNPHGPQVRARWAEWKQTLDALDFDTPHRLAIIDAARETFNAIGAMMSDVHQAMPAISAAMPEVVVPPRVSAQKAGVTP
jgi:heme oxygenase